MNQRPWFKAYLYDVLFFWEILIYLQADYKLFKDSVGIR